MKKTLSYLLWSLLFAIIYMVLLEAFTPLNAAVGFILALLSLLIADWIMLDTPYGRAFRLRPLLLLRYSIYLLYRIILSGLQATLLILKGNVQVRYFCYNSSLNDDLLNNILANSITLTPGTVTVDKEGNKLLVMQLVHQDEAQDITSIAKFEKIIAPIKGGWT